MTDASKIRYEWYQSDSHVTLEVFAKQLRVEDVAIEFGQQSLTLTAKLPSGAEYVLTLDPLSQPIVADECHYTVLSTKVEVRLRKALPGQWRQLEGHRQQPDTEPLAPSASIRGGDEVPPSYPSSSKRATNWDRLAREMTEPEPGQSADGEGGDALNALFQQIYADADDDTRRAMIKSFTESGGTSLSTNWDEVGHKRVEVVPPKGMEQRKY